MYGKIINGEFTPAPNPLSINKQKIYNPTPAEYKAAGYLEVIEAECPGDMSKHYKREYSEQNGAIYAVWVKVDMPAKAPMLEDRVFAVEAQLTDTQLALCELYETLCAADKEV